MPANDFDLSSTWRVLGSPAEAYDLLTEVAALPLWWPAAVLDALALEPGDENGIGRVVRLRVRGWLPLTLFFHAAMETADRPHGFSLRVWGDVNGSGDCRIHADGAWTKVSFHWRVRVSKPVVRLLAPIAKAVFVASYRWAMARGEESIRIALTRRRGEGGSDAFLAPPAAAPRLPLAAIGLVAAASVWLLLLRRRR